jgi:hypothetical protein
VRVIGNEMDYKSKGRKEESYFGITVNSIRKFGSGTVKGLAVLAIGLPLLACESFNRDPIGRYLSEALSRNPLAISISKASVDYNVKCGTKTLRKDNSTYCEKPPKIRADYMEVEGSGEGESGDDGTGDDGTGDDGDTGGSGGDTGGSGGGTGGSGGGTGGSGGDTGGSGGGATGGGGHGGGDGASTR